MYLPCSGKGTLKIRITEPLYDAKGKQELSHDEGVYQCFPAGLYFWQYIIDL